MPFSPITVNAKNYVASGSSGRYMYDGVSFGDPLDYFKISGGTYNSKTKNVTGGVTRHFEKTVTQPNGQDVVKTCVVSLSVVCSKDFSSTELDGLADDISDFLTVATIDRWMNGEQ